MRCQDTYLCTKNRHRVYLVKNPVDNHFSLWITPCHVVFNTTSLLVYSVRCPSVNLGAVLSGSTTGKIFFCALFLIFSKNFSVLKTPVFACFRLFYEPLRARAFSLSLKKTARKIFLKKGLTRGYTRAIMETLQGGTPQDRRTASMDARTVRTVSTLRIVVAPADSIPRTGVGYSTPNVHAESRRGIGTCIACTTMSAGAVKTV